MTLKTLLCAIAEGGAADARGNLTAIGIEPGKWIVSKGSQLTPTIVIVAEDDLDAPLLFRGEPLSFTVSATGPDGDTLFFAQQTASVQEKVDPALPHRINLIAQVPLTPSATGVHAITAAVRAREEVTEWNRNLLIEVVDG